MRWTDGVAEGWVIYGSLNARMRILRATLGALEALHFNEGPVLYDERCTGLAGVLESEVVLVSQMTKIAFIGAFREGEGATRVFQAMGKATAVKSLLELYISERGLTTEAFHALSSTLKTNALPRLKFLSLTHTRFESDDLATLLQSLERSTCAQTFRKLNLNACGISAEGAKVLGLAIERDSLPSLEVLDISDNTLGQGWSRPLDSEHTSVLSNQNRRPSSEICGHG